MKGRTSKKRRLAEVVHGGAHGQVTITRGSDVSHEFPVHVHHTYTMGIVESGARVIRHEGTETLVQVGDCFVIEPGQPHSCATLCAAGHTYTTISVDPDLMSVAGPGMGDQANGVIRFPKVAFHDRELFYRIRSLWNDLPELCSGDYFAGRVFRILRSLFSRHATTDSLGRPSAWADWSVGEALRFMKANCDRNLSQREIAEVARLSEFHFNRTFSRLVGVPPHAYHLRVRIRKAQKLLGQGASIVEAALETGFNDQSHFTHSFKRTVGVTPGHYRLVKLV